MRLYFLLVTSLVAGCMPLQQIDWESSISEIRIAPKRNVLYISIMTSTTDRTKKPSIDVSRSYAVHDGQRYRIQSKKNSYVSPGESPWTMEIVNLAPASTDATQQLEWENGKWELHLEFKGTTQRDPIDAKFSLRTFWYSPLIHGMPN